MTLNENGDLIVFSYRVSFNDDIRHNYVLEKKYIKDLIQDLYTIYKQYFCHNCNLKNFKFYDPHFAVKHHNPQRILYTNLYFRHKYISAFPIKFDIFCNGFDDMILRVLVDDDTGTEYTKKNLYELIWKLKSYKT